MYINRTWYIHIEIIEVGCDDDHIALMLVIRAIQTNDPQYKLLLFYRLMGLGTASSPHWKSLCQCTLPPCSRPPIFRIGTLGEWWSVSWQTTTSLFLKISSCLWCPTIGWRWKVSKSEGGPLPCLTDSTCIYCSEEIFGATKQFCLRCLVFGGLRLLCSTPKHFKSTGSSTIERWRRQT